MNLNMLAECAESCGPLSFNEAQQFIALTERLVGRMSRQTKKDVLAIIKAPYCDKLHQLETEVSALTDLGETLATALGSKRQAEQLDKLLKQVDQVSTTFESLF